jgi:hypothetical protein
MLKINSLQSDIAADPKRRASGCTEAAQKSESVSDKMMRPPTPGAARLNRIDVAGQGSKGDDVIARR